MNREEMINKRLREHYEHLENLGYEIVFLALQGSQNYELDIYRDDYMSDVDSKAIVLPSFEDFVSSKHPISTTLVMENKEMVDVKDVRVMFDVMKKMNISYIELLYTKYKIINPKYKDIVDYLFENKEEISKINRNQFLRCLSGMSMEKLKALKHPYPNLIDKINKYGFDGKQLSHLIRLNEFIYRYCYGEDLSDCYISQMKESLINIKMNKDELGDNIMSLDRAESLAESYNSSTKLIKDNNLSEKDVINQKGIDILNKVNYDLLRRKFKQDLKDEENL